MSFLSRSDDSDSSGLSTLSRNSRGRRSSTADINSNRHEDIPGSPPLKKLRRSDYNAFASLVNNLKQERPPKPLNERLLARSVTPSRSRPATATADRDDTPLVELSRAIRDGHDVLFDAQTRVDHSLDDRWPLYARQLGQGADFAETVGIVASKMVRLRRLVNPYLQNITRVVDDTLDEGDDVIAPLPEDLVESTRMYLDKLLAGLAILRPPLTRPQRERLAPTGWKAVLETAGLVKHGSSVAQSANERVSSLFGPEDVSGDMLSEQHCALQIQQRLELITSQRTKRVPREEDGDVLAAVLKPKRPNKHQISVRERQARVEARREKTGAKLAQIAERRAVKQAKTLKKDKAYQQQIADEKEEIEIKKRLARADKKRKREAEKAEKEDRKRVRAERRERKKKRAERRTERALSTGLESSREARAKEANIRKAANLTQDLAATAALAHPHLSKRSGLSTDLSTIRRNGSEQGPSTMAGQRVKPTAYPPDSGALSGTRVDNHVGASNGPSANTHLTPTNGTQTNRRGKKKR